MWIFNDITFESIFDSIYIYVKDKNLYSEDDLFNGDHSLIVRVGMHSQF